VTRNQAILEKAAPKGTGIHPTAVVHPTARLAEGVEVGPYAVIGAEVEIGEGTIVGPHVVIQGPSKIGAMNHFFQFSSIGEAPQDKKYQGERTWLEIGDRNVIRENVTINRGTQTGGGVTSIGNDNLLMAYVHIAHDCHVGNNTVFSNNASLAGHVIVDDYANLGGFVGVHQFCMIGQRAFLAGGSMVVKDVPPFVTVSGYPAKVYGLNTVGLRRALVSAYSITLLRRAYKIVYRQGLTLQNAVSEIEPLAAESPELKLFLDFIKQERSRGITR